MLVTAIVIIAEPMLVAIAVAGVLFVALLAFAAAIGALVLATTAAVAAVSAAVLLAAVGLVAASPPAAYLVAPETLLVASAIAVGGYVPPRHSVARAHAQARLPCARVVA